MFLSLRDLTLLAEAVQSLIAARRSRRDIILGRVEYEREVSSIEQDIAQLEDILMEVENTAGLPT